MKAQVQARIVIYILAVFIAGTILLYGYTVVRGLVTTQEQVQILDFEKTLKDEVKSLSFSFRDIKDEKLVLPSRYELVCFASIDSASVADVANLAQEYPLVKDSISDKVKRNVFLLSNGKMRYGFYAGTIDVNINDIDGFGCINASNGILKVRLEALGRKVSVSEW